MANPNYGQNKSDFNIQDVVDLFRPDQIGQVEGKGFIAKKGTVSFSGGDTTTTKEIISFGTNTSVWGGFVRVEGIGNNSGSLDFDLGLTAGASDFGAAYGDSGDGVYAIKAHDFIAVASEDCHFSIDANTIPSSATIKVTVVLITAVAPASS
tara:strand:+ start:539 stop:994 length:456 start_codon:yes stop_codon:yes gene_type:complete